MEEITQICARALGEAMKRARLQRGLSQEAFADVCGLDRSYIGQVERGEKNISLESVLRVANGLNVKPSQLFAAADY